MWEANILAGICKRLPTGRALVYLGALVCVVLAVSVTQARAANVIDLGNFLPMSVNNSDQVAGDVGVLNDNSGTANPAAGVWIAGTTTTLPELSGTQQSDAYEINAAGQIVGDDQVADPGLSVHGATWNLTGPIMQLGPFFNAANSDDDFTVAEAIDTAGDIVGTSPPAAGGCGGSAFFYQNGTAIPVGSCTTSAVDAIAANGSTILVSDQGGYSLVPTATPSAAGTSLDITPSHSGAELLGGSEWGAYLQNDVSSDGAVVGYKSTSTNIFVRLPAGTEVPVTGLQAANAINASHDVVGTITNSTTAIHAAMWEPNGTVIDLNSLLPANSGYVLLDALAINDNGDIVGLADSTTTGNDVGFLLSGGTRASTTSVRCVPSTSPPFTCTATVSDSSGQSPPRVPTGTVSFSATVGQLAAQSCTLVAVSGSSAACSVGVTPSTPTQVSTTPTQITANYPGDTNFTQSVGTTALNNFIITMTDNPTQVSTGWQDTYSITVSNVGPAVTNVPFIDSLPLQLVYQSVGGDLSQGTPDSACQVSGGSATDPNIGGGTVRCTIPSISQNGGVTFTITTNVDNASEQIVNTATVNTTTTGSHPIAQTNYSNDSQTVYTQIPLPQGQGWQATWQKLQDQLGASAFNKLVSGAPLHLQCASYQTIMLQRLDKIHQSDPAALKGLAYGPVTDQVHNGDVVYLQGTSYYDTGVVLHGTPIPGIYDLPGEDIVPSSSGPEHLAVTGWTAANGVFVATPITRWEAYAKTLHPAGSLVPASSIHELDGVYGYYFEGTYPATGTHNGVQGPVPDGPVTPDAMVVSTRSPVEIHLTNSAGQQVQTQDGTLAVDQFPSPVTGNLGLDAAGNFDWDLVLPVDRYKITLVGTASGPYTVILTGFTAKGTPIQTTYHGVTSVGKTSSPVSFIPLVDVANRFGLTVARSGDRIVLKLNAPGPGSILATADTTVPTPRTSVRAKAKRTSRHQRTVTIVYGKVSASVVHAHRVRLVIRPGRTGAALSRKRPLRVSIAVTFSPTGGLPRTKHRSVSVKPTKPHVNRS